MIGKCKNCTATFEPKIYSDEEKTQVINDNSEVHVSNYGSRIFITLTNESYFDKVDYLVNIEGKKGVFHGANVLNNAVEIIGGLK